MNGSNTSNYTNGSNTSAEMEFIASRHAPYVVLCILAVVMNTFVILLFTFNKNLRKPINFLLVSLSVSDLLFGSVGLPLALVCSTTPACVPCVLSYVFVVFTSISTVLHILVISYERYFKILFPFKMQQIGRASFEIKLVVCVWFISILLPPIQFAWWPPTEEVCAAGLSEEAATKERIYSVSIMVIFGALPVLLLLYADVSVFFVVRRQLDGIDKTSVGPRDSRERLLKETRVLALFAVMMLYFVISWSFFYATIIATAILQTSLLVPDWLFLLSEVLRCSTPLVNPILYILLKHDFRRVVWLGVRQLVLKKYGGLRKGSNELSTNGALTAGGRTYSRNVTEKTEFL